MKYLFSPAGLHLLKSLRQNNILFAFDYDGTLAPLKVNLRLATIPKIVEKELVRLNKAATVAIVSGRGLRDLGRCLPFKPKYLVGNHGSEGVKLKGFSGEKSLKVCAQWHRQLKKERLERDIEIEDKRFSLSLHYRRVSNRRKAKNRLVEIAKALDPKPHIILGKCVVNVLPSFAPTKGDAVKALMKVSKKKWVLYAGDDKTDEYVFTLKSRRVIGVRVGYSKKSRAGYFIKSRNEMLRLLSIFI